MMGGDNDRIGQEPYHHGVEKRAMRERDGLPAWQPCEGHGTPPGAMQGIAGDTGESSMKKGSTGPSEVPSGY